MPYSLCIHDSHGLHSGSGGSGTTQMIETDADPFHGWNITHIQCKLARYTFQSRDDNPSVVDYYLPMPEPSFQSAIIFRFVH